jgi:hypothetical protein
MKQDGYWAISDQKKADTCIRICIYVLHSQNISSGVSFLMSGIGSERKWPFLVVENQHRTKQSEIIRLTKSEVTVLISEQLNTKKAPKYDLISRI